MAKKTAHFSPRYLFYTRRYLVLGIALIVTASLVGIIGFWSQLQASLSLWQTRQAEQQRVITLEQKAATLATLVSPELQAQSQAVNTLLPSRKPVLELLASLSTVAGQSQVVLQGIELTPGSIATESARTSTSSRNSDQLSVQLVVIGQLGQINQFVELIEKTAPFSTVTKLSLSPQGRSTFQAIQGNEDYTANIEITTNFFTQSLTSSVTGTLPQLSAQDEQLLTQISDFALLQTPDFGQITGGGQEDLFGIPQQQFEVR